jgi:hypothetical protein
MKAKTFYILLVAAFSLADSAFAARQPNLSPLQIQEMQSRQFEVEYEVLFSSVVSVLQDSGYRIDSADRYSGFIRGTAPSKTRLGFFVDKKDTSIVSVFVEKIATKMQNVRLNFVLTSERNYGLGTVSKDEIPVLDRQVYADAFERISKAAFLRSSLQATEEVKPEKLAVDPPPRN